MSNQQAARLEGLTSGSPVITSDGEQLGTVKELSGNAFKVNAPMAADYWLSCEHVVSTGDGGVRLQFTRDQLDHYRLSNPGPHTSESPALDAESNTFVSEGEKTRTRERMEHPPAAQN